MNIGLLILDADPRASLSEKVHRAARAYERKFGRRPNVCCVHPGALADGPVQVGDVMVEGRIAVLKDHFWVGEKKDGGAGA